MELSDKLKKIKSLKSHDDKVKEIAEEFIRVCKWPVEEVRQFYSYWKAEGDEEGVLACMQLLIAEHKGAESGINERIRASIAERKAA